MFHLLYFAIQLPGANNTFFKVYTSFSMGSRGEQEAKMIAILGGQPGSLHSDKNEFPNWEPGFANVSERQRIY